MSDISLNDLDLLEDLKNMPSGEVTDTEDIPDQSTAPDFGGYDD